MRRTRAQRDSTSFVLTKIKQVFNYTKSLFFYPSIEKTDDIGLTPLHEEAEYGRIDNVRALIQRGANINAEDNFGRTPLHLAIREGRTATVRVLLQHGAEVDKKDKIGDFPALLAVSFGEAQILQDLISYNADIYMKDGSDRSLLNTAVYGGFPDIVRILIENGANISETDEHGQSLIYHAVNLNNAEMVDVLAELGADVNEYVDGSSLLHLAAQGGFTDTVIELIKHNAELDITDTNGATPLEVTIAAGDVSTVSELLKYVDDIDYFYLNGFTLLHMAAGYGYTDIVDALIAEGASVNLGDQQRHITPLHLAAESGHKDSVLSLLNEQNINAADSDGFTPLYYAAAHGQLEVVNIILDVLGDADIPNIGRDLAANQNLCLLQAAEDGDLSTLKRLLAYPEVMNNITTYENAVLQLAQEGEHQAIVDYLLQIDAVKNYVKPTPEAPELGAIVLDAENSMRIVDEEQEGLITNIIKRYESKFEEMGGEKGVLENLRIYLESNFSLPLQYSPKLPSQLAYFKDIDHTAWRYLFCRPNPWISDEALFFDTLPCGGRAATILPNDKLICAYLWLAASGDDFEPIDGFTHARIKEDFVKEIALIGRAHNYDKQKFNKTRKKWEDVDDLEGDKPSCPNGVTQRLLQAVKGNPITQLPSSRVLNAMTFKQCLVEQLITQHDDYPNNLYGQLSQWTADALSQLRIVLTKQAMGTEDLTVNEIQILAQLKIDEKDLMNFMQNCDSWFGGRVNDQIEIAYQDKKFPNYEQLARYFISQVGQSCYHVLENILDNLIDQKLKYDKDEENNLEESIAIKIKLR